MAILNYTTTIAASKSVAEVQHILAKAGVRQINVQYEHGAPASLEFMLLLSNQPVYFRLPSNTHGVLEALKASPQVPRSKSTEEQARRVAWRIIKDWTAAQIAVVEAGQAEIAEVFLPYAIVYENQTMFQVFADSKRKLLTEGQ